MFPLLPGNRLVGRMGQMMTRTEEEERQNDTPTQPNHAREIFVRRLQQASEYGQIDPYQFLQLLKRYVHVLSSDFPGVPETRIRSLIDRLPGGSYLHVLLHTHLRRGEFSHAIKLISSIIAQRLPRRFTHGDVFDLWKKWWPVNGETRSPINRNYTVTRDDEPCLHLNIPETCEVMEGHPFIPNVSGILVRTAYETALKQIYQWYKQEPKTGILLIGHPGIGKTLFLYYLLVLRLCEGKPTAFQTDSSTVLIFSKGGVEELQGNWSWEESTQEIPGGTWALVDSTIKRPSTFIKSGKSPFFVVEAICPREDPWDDWARLKGPVLRFPMKPWTAEELIVGRGLQEDPPSEKRLYDFYIRFGPSAREAYRRANQPDIYYHSLRQMIRGLSWARLESFCRLACTYPPQGCYKIILIQPNPENHLYPDRSIITRTVLELLWEFYLGHQRVHAGELYKQFSLNWGSQTTAQWILECTARDRLRRGGEWPILPMTTSGLKHHKKQVIYTLPPVQIGESLRLRKLEYLRWDVEDTSLLLKPNTYYETRTTYHPVFHSFTYDPQKHQVSLFQSVLSGLQDLSAYGFRQIEKILEHNDIADYRIRYVAVIEEGQTSLKIRVPLTLVDKVEVWVFRIDVY